MFSSFSFFVHDGHAFLFSSSISGSPLFKRSSSWPTVSTSFCNTHDPGQVPSFAYPLSYHAAVHIVFGRGYAQHGVRSFRGGVILKIPGTPRAGAYPAGKLQVCTGGSARALGERQAADHSAAANIGNIKSLMLCPANWISAGFSRKNFSTRSVNPASSSFSLCP